MVRIHVPEPSDDDDPEELTFAQSAALARETQWQRRCGWLEALERGERADPGPPERWQVDRVREDWWRKLTGRA